MFNFKETFSSLRKSLDGMEQDFSEAFTESSCGITITNNNGHIVIVGKIKTLNVNGVTVQSVPKP